MKYVKSLDSIRAIAVLLVIVTHWFPKDLFIYSVAKAFNGVDVFFTLSGFLITGILLQDRAEAEQFGQSRMQTFKNFFFRRVLRIFPIYYLTIFLIYLYNPSGEDIQFRYFLSFTSNFHYYAERSWGMLAHSWSLAVEEQFYLVWPWVVLFISRKWLPYMMVLFIFSGIITQQLLDPNEFSWILPMPCVDALALGGLLGWIIYARPDSLEQVYQSLRRIAMVALGFTLLRIAFHLSFPSTRTLTAFITLWAICYCLVHDGQRFHQYSLIFNNKFLIFLGRMSYGMYLFHFLIPYYTKDAFTWEYQHIVLPASIKDHYGFYLAQNFVILIGVSWLSFHLIEQPVLRLKKYFRNRPAAQPGLPGTAEPVTVSG